MKRIINWVLCCFGQHDYRPTTVHTLFGAFPAERCAHCELLRTDYP